MKARVWLFSLVLLTVGTVLIVVALAQPQVARASVTEGEVLFRNKGCATCHLHADITGSGAIPTGPSLSAYRNEPAFLRRWLADPALVKPGTQMPNLNLSTSEIEDLTAFLNQPR